ncbi:MAG: hypothetical protein K2Q32_03570 [Alphaproteobacteria bacterium]|nr:hypothetical protein [Alphaproteobacteria bacterium]
MSYASGVNRDVNTSVLENAALSTADEALRTFHFPPEMIGGSCPYVKGEEETVAWHAAAEACASERIHFVWRVHGDRVWYLAIRSEDMASQTKSWCPFASLLPGAPDALEAPVIYTFYSDEAATLMAIERESLQIIRGTSSVVRAKAERLAREVGAADIVDLIPDRIIALQPVPWESLSLLENRGRRFMSFAAVLLAVAVIALSIFVWFMASVTQLAYKSDLHELQSRTAQSLTQLEQTAMVLRTSDMREQIANFIKLNESLIGAQGWLKLYLLKDNNVKWWGVVPQNLTSNRIQEFGGQTIESSDEGLVVANGKDSYLRKGQIK